MKFNQWTLGLAAAGVINLASAAKAEEAPSQVLTALSSTTLSGYVDTSANWKFGTGLAVPGRFNDGTSKQDGFNLNVVKLSLEKPLSEGEWSAGYKFDMLFGPDAGLFLAADRGSEALFGSSPDFCSDLALGPALPLGPKPDFLGPPNFPDFDMPGFCGRAMLMWAHQRNVALRLIEPGKPNQNAYVESFNGRFRDECLNEHWFETLLQARAEIASWRTDYNEVRPHSSCDRMPPARFASLHRQQAADAARP
jgi:putative transposase